MSASGHPVATQWTLCGHLMVNKWSLSGHQVVTKLNTCTYQVMSCLTPQTATPFSKSISSYGLSKEFPQVMLVATDIDTGGIPAPAITLNARCFQQFIYFSCVL